jgi:hypothetical protein
MSVTVVSDGRRIRLLAAVLGCVALICREAFAQDTPKTATPKSATGKSTRMPNSEIRNYVDRAWGLASREALGRRASIKGSVDGPELSPYHTTLMCQDTWRVTNSKYKRAATR